MFLWWQQTDRGNLWIESRGVRQLLEGMLPERCVVRAVDFWKERQTAAVRLGYANGEGGVSDEALRAVGDDVRAFLAPLGFGVVEVSWTEEGEVEDHSWRRWMGRPETWGVAAGVLVAVGRLGWDGTFGALIAGGGAFGVAWLVLTPRGQDKWKIFCRKAIDLWYGGAPRPR
ncbi:MAG TPA: hypothetical protein PK393_02705 [Synergistaceae bacterium]|nr:hypothetical protein [Synergistaceae bacterium]HQH77746.1 hypothetical protein [Synergistaceae bacterium]HQK24416.1 hypothetical protein [Synergistaceae bacterium]